MSKKKGASKKKELLDEPNSLKDGNCEYFIRGWSYYQNVDCITEISHRLIAAHTNEKREVEPLSRVNIMVFPHEGSAEEEEGSTVEVELADKIYIEGVFHSVVAQASRNEKDWPRPKDPASEGAPTEEGETVAAEEDTKEEAAEEQGTETQKEESSTVTANDSPVYTTSVGADSNSRDVRIHGKISLNGVAPQIVVQPQLPQPPSGGDAKNNTTNSMGGTKKGKGKKAKKLTPEEQEELDRKKAEEEALYLKQTEEAIEQAKRQEDYLMTFAHPDRWAVVEIVNVTFTGPVKVNRAHVTFRNCVFVARDAATPQLTVSQYCKVNCVKCTFEAPLHSSLYTLPLAHVAVRKCLFTGIPQPLLAQELSLDVVSKKDHQDAVDDGESGVGGLVMSDLALTPTVQSAYATMLEDRSAIVAVYYDGSASLVVERCRVAFYGTGVLLRGHSAFHKTNSPTIKVSKSCFNYFCNTAFLVMGNSRDIWLSENHVSDCAYYGLDCQGGSKEIHVTKNNFSVGTAVKLRAGTDVKLLQNSFHSIPIDENKAENANHAPTY